MRTMYDALTARNILKKDLRPVLVAGYIDRIKLAPWTDADWALFPDALKVEIVKKASTNDGHVLDVEPGDARPDEAPGWAAMRRRSGFAYPVIYCNRSTWPLVKAAFADQGVEPPLYWIATATGRREIPDGAIAAQYLLDVAPGIDISVVADFWPGVDQTPNSGGGAAPTGQLRHEESIMERLQAGTNQSLSFDIPSWAKEIRVNCPEGFVTVHALYQSGDGLPQTAKAGVPDFDWKASYETDKRVDRLRPWRVSIAGGATNGSIRWTFDPAHPERTASLSFR